MKTKTFLNQIDSSMFSENEQLILDYFCKHQNNLPYLSLSDICRDLFLSNATIVRFCQKLGFEGFNELKFSLRNELNASSDFSNSWQMLQRRTAVLKDFMDNLDTAKIEIVCSEILTTKSLYIYGRNMSSLPAKYLYSMLNSIDIPCIYIDWIDFLQALSGTLPENAVLIIFTNYGEKTIYQPIVDRCHKRNVKIIWISSTDIDHSLIVPSDTYIWTQEQNLEHVHLRTKMTSFLFVQIIVEYLRSNVKEQEDLV